MGAWLVVATHCFDGVCVCVCVLHSCLAEFAQGSCFDFTTAQLVQAASKTCIPSISCRVES